jgi:coenzyme Q-binding protein COQ10
VTKITKSIEINASPEKVFAWSYEMKNMNEAMKGFMELEQTSNGPFGVGTTMHGIGKAGGQQVETDMEVTEFVKNKKVVMHSIGAGKFKMTGSWTYEPSANGTKVTYDMEYEVPYSILGKLVDKLRVHKDIEKNNTIILERMKKAIEA